MRPPRESDYATSRLRAEGDQGGPDPTIGQRLLFRDATFDQLQLNRFSGWVLDLGGDPQRRWERLAHGSRQARLRLLEAHLVALDGPLAGQVQAPAAHAGPGAIGVEPNLPRPTVRVDRQNRIAESCAHVRPGGWGSIAAKRRSQDGGYQERSFCHGDVMLDRPKGAVAMRQVRRATAGSHGSQPAGVGV